MKDVANIIEYLKNQIKSLFSNFNGIYLYGSYANKTNNDDSDIDIVAIFDKSLTREDRMKLWTLVGTIEAEYNVIFDLHPMNNEELKQNPIYYNQVVNKGIFYGV